MDSIYCRRCGGSLDNVTRGPWNRVEPGSADILPPEWWARHCPECGWLNLERSSPVRWSLSHFISPILSEFSGPDEARDSGAAVAVLRSIRSDIVARLTRIVSDHPREIAALVFAMLGNLYELESTSGFKDSAVKVLQQWLFILLVNHGALPIPSEDLVAGVIDSALWQGREHEQMVIALIRINYVLELASYGVSVSFADGIVTVGDLDDESMWVAEINANIEASQLVPSGELQAQNNDPLIIEIERSTFGDSVGDMSVLLGDLDRLREFTRVKTSPDGELITVDYHSAPPRLKHLLREFSLTHERLRSHPYPAFFFTGGMAERTDAEIIDEAADMDWLTYAPLVNAVYYDGDEIRSARVTTGFLAYRMSSKAGSCLAFRLQRAIDTMRARYPDLTPSVREAVRKYHSLLEGTVLRIFVDSGMQAVQNVNRFAGRELPCGEIDVIAVGQNADGAPVVCVTEVKDTDVSFYKGPGASQAAETVRRGSGQADRKARWLAGNMQLLRETFPDLRSGPVTHILPLVVTRHTAMPLGPGLPPVVSRYELGNLVSMLLQSPPESWRRDFRLAVRTQ